MSRLDEDRFDHDRRLGGLPAGSNSVVCGYGSLFINGQELARLLIRYGVGVRPRTTFVVSGIDEDYFAEV